MIEGKLLSERYKIEKLIGGGGMANVYLGEDTILNRQVAIKVLKFEYANDQEFIARFHREAQAATSLSHPNIVSIYDVGEEEDIYFMVMEYISGLTLKEYIQMHAPIVVDEVIDIMSQITSAISHAHDNGIIHRDIKPQNMLIDSYGQVKVTDFGIAIALSATALTQTNSVLGSVHYLSPEQARGGKANRKSDIYSLGIVMFELITGHLPFSGQSAVSIALKHLQHNLPTVRESYPHVPQSVENIVLQATAKDPFHRYANVYEMEDDLNVALYPEHMDAEPFQVPDSDEEITKAIPIVGTESQENMKNANQDTMIRQTNNESEDQGVANENRKKKRKKTVIWVTTLFFVLCGAILLALFILPSWFQPKDVTIPDVSGMEYDQALEELTNLNLSVTRENRTHEEIEADQVIETMPEVDDVVKEGREITVFVSQGPEKVTMEDYVGRELEQVEEELHEAGFEEIRTYEQFSEQPVGEIIAQTEPEPGREVVPRDTNVIFEVSKGTEKITLSRLVGMHVDEATSYLEENELNHEVIKEHHDDVEKNHVIEQTPSANEQVEKEEVVELIVSSGPEEEPPITHSVSFTVPYTNDENHRDDSDDPEPQAVSIYVGDMEHDITELYQEVEMITEDTMFSIDLTIAPDSEATYRVLREDQEIINKSIAYDDIKGE
ncbi:serine/threonine protein kinase [Gracilibacillus halophilus YIM-C55.5]|uniref:Serine/threonine-protein kinase PrkC n=1 Tax=Gracilibacillus halophilus YIM-C55.5 TaxID=1308866 RepID=N4WG86_9BACI|nr:Stk1 family PASTA domain-containing Ser/Thr kinase [Gracilibacillus halophilus]ENH98284.1 serine/threonine protein kinase [Gracilibacillus halophilus YIM-C55.5]